MLNLNQILCNRATNLKSLGSWKQLTHGDCVFEVMLPAKMLLTTTTRGAAIGVIALHDFPFTVILPIYHVIRCHGSSEHTV